jgi:hypothetical protein
MQHFNFIGPILRRGETKLGSKWAGFEIPSSEAGGHITDLAFPLPELCGKSHFANPRPLPPANPVRRIIPTAEYCAAENHFIIS